MRRIALAVFILLTAHLHNLMMKHYKLYVFTQDACAPCARLKNYVETLSEDERAELDFVPLKTASGQRTALAEELAVELTPTLVVCHETISCEIDSDDEEYCELEEESVERFVGAAAIIENLDSVLDAYTYAHPE
jgi:hypothetical protein